MKDSKYSKVALITGATSGIGKEAALLFAKNGIHVIATGRNSKEGEDLVDLILASKGSCQFIPSDLATSSSLTKFFQKIGNTYSHLDYAINAAGIEGDPQKVYEIDEENWDEVINTNLKGTWLCLKHEFKLMKEKGGSIVNISSFLTKMTTENTGAYATSKAGIESLSRVAAIEYSEHNIRVNSILPGAVDTPMLKRIYNPNEIKKMKTMNPLKKIASARNIASTIFWLCDSESNHINGASIIIDGGQSLL